MDLVILAGGKGSRFGGPKQLEPVGPENLEQMFIVDFSIYDAVLVGVDRVVIITGEDMADTFNNTLGERLRKANIPIKIFVQRKDDVPFGTEIPSKRTKPWGTTHAICVAKEVLSDGFAIAHGGKFIVINADDFYGRESFRMAVDFLKNNDSDLLNIGFHIKNCLSDKGAVKRGMLQVDGDSAVKLIESDIKRLPDGSIVAAPLGTFDCTMISDDAPVSMNMFGFNQELLEILNEEMERFFREEDLNTAESLISVFINKKLASKEVTMKVLQTPEKWYGITYREELAEFKKVIEQKLNSGEYPLDMLASLNCKRT